MVDDMLASFLVLLLSASASAQSVYYFSGAIEIWPAATNPSAAVPAQCPADHPTSCGSIQQPNFCCPVNNYCAWANGVVACCPNGQVCSGAVSGAGWQPTTTYWQPATTTAYYYAPAPATVVVVPAPVTTQYTTAAPKYGNVHYCSTLVANGPNLPTTAAGSCGTILVIAPSAATRSSSSWGLAASAVFAVYFVVYAMLWRR